MKISSLLVLLIISLFALTGCDPNPVMRVQSVPLNSILGVGSGSLGWGILNSDFVNSSSWFSESGSFSYAVGVEVEIEKDIISEIDTKYKALHIRFGFTTSKPERGTHFNMFDDARAIFIAEDKTIERRFSSRRLLKAIVMSDGELFKNIIKSEM